MTRSRRITATGSHVHRLPEMRADAGRHRRRSARRPGLRALRALRQRVQRADRAARGEPAMARRIRRDAGRRNRAEVDRPRARRRCRDGLEPEPVPTGARARAGSRRGRIVLASDIDDEGPRRRLPGVRRGSDGRLGHLHCTRRFRAAGLGQLEAVVLEDEPAHTDTIAADDWSMLDEEPIADAESVIRRPARSRRSAEGARLILRRPSRCSREAEATRDCNARRRPSRPMYRRTGSTPTGPRPLRSGRSRRAGVATRRAGTARRHRTE